MNFGPINKVGGERRLNVAMTRARSEMVVFSTLSPDLIDLKRTSARGVADLKHFLEYAERGPVALGSQARGSQGDFESPFEVAVARELQAKGWQLHPQVGVSAYRIDMGIVHPDLPGRYLAGLECDGAMYHSSAYACERDKIRQSVLESLGWTIVRVWSTDWWVNKQASLQLLNDRLTELLEESRAKIALEKAKQEKEKGLTVGAEAEDAEFVEHEEID
jgi:very-short-patch-repair endonuclease